MSDWKNLNGMMILNLSLQIGFFIAEDTALKV